MRFSFLRNALKVGDAPSGSGTYKVSQENFANGVPAAWIAL
jgi:hypothetical protein